MKLVANPGGAKNFTVEEDDKISTPTTLHEIFSYTIKIQLSFIYTATNTSRSKVTNYVRKQSVICTVTISMTMGEFCTGDDDSKPETFNR